MGHMPYKDGMKNIEQWYIEANKNQEKYLITVINLLSIDFHLLSNDSPHWNVLKDRAVPLHVQSCLLSFERRIKKQLGN